MVRLLMGFCVLGVLVVLVFDDVLLVLMKYGVICFVGRFWVCVIVFILCEY